MQGSTGGQGDAGLQGPPGEPGTHGPIGPRGLPGPAGFCEQVPITDGSGGSGEGSGELSEASDWKGLTTEADVNSSARLKGEKGQKVGFLSMLSGCYIIT